jgi:type II secretory pathway pseudopilin PulG
MVRVPASPSLPFPPHRRAPAAGPAPAAHRRSRAFSLLEILMALFILMIGVVIVGTVFPVAGDWTRQATEHTIAQEIARNAISLIQAKYRAGDFIAVHEDLSEIPAGPLSFADHAYNYGSRKPLPTVDGEAIESLYFWRAYVRHLPANPSGAIDVFILVFKKGEASQTYRRTDTDEHFPIVVAGPYRDGTEIPPPGTPPYNPRIFPPIGDYGIGVRTGTVFRQHLGALPGIAAPSAPVGGSPGLHENVLWAPPALGTDVSPLVYVYHTTLAF